MVQKRCQGVWTYAYMMVVVVLMGVVAGTAPKKPVPVPFGKNYVPTWAFDHIKYFNGDSHIQLLLDKYTGTGFQSKGSYLFGHFSMRIKMVPGDSAGTVTAFYSPDGDIIDCVRISDQPAFDHPLLKNHTIKMRPRVSPMMNTSEDESSSSSSSITQLWHSNGKCPKGTIPIRRTKKEDVLRAGSVKNYGKKKGFSIAQQGSIDAELDDRARHEYAIAYNYGEFYGTQATLNLWNPKVQENANEFSLAQVWIVGGSTDTIEAGWQVYPWMYGDTNTRLFIYWTSDNYQTTGCYNLGCSGFVQTNNKIAIGGSLSPTSQTDGSQVAITILIWKDGKAGDWWMQLNGELVGYWPSSLYSKLSTSASLLEWGGEVVNLGLNGQHTTTQMGSGRFPQQGFRKASYIRNIQTVDGTNTFRTPNLNTIQTKGCYEILTSFSNDNYWAANFFFGGPGRNANCK